MIILKETDIKYINTSITGNNNINVNLSCYSSIFYYNSIENKVSSVVRSLIKNHPFSDGNKRTALLVLDTLSDLNNINRIISDDDIDEIIVDIAMNNYSVEEISKKIFGR